MAQTEEIEIDRTIFAEAKRLALMALNSATRYKTPPVPRIYEVWFTYYSGHNPGLTKRVDQARRAGEVLDGPFIEQVYDEHLSPEAMKGGINRFGDRLEAEMSRVMDTIGAGMSSGDYFSNVLGEVRAGLNPKIPPENFGRLVGLLQEASTAYAQETQRMAQDLQEARAQVASVKRDLQELRESAFLDHVTRLPNRRQFEEALEQEIATARERSEELCVARCDIDEIRTILEQWGDETTELVFRKFAEILRQNIRGRDVPARLGGDSFALILPGTALSGAHVMAEHIRRSLGRTVFTAKPSGKRMDKVTASFGVAALRPNDGIGTLVARADDFLARAKDSGRDQVWSAE
ncbi:MAG: diguanylate cyclase [Pseudomonadota bacterium]